MEDIKNNLREVKEYTMDRLKMPIFFYYFVILAIWNWDIILLIVRSNLPIESIITLIQEQKFDKWRYICPLLIAIAGNIAFPLIMLGLDYPLTWINKRRNKKASDVEIGKAKHEFSIQVERTGSESLKSLQGRINALTNDTLLLNDTIKTNNENYSIKEEQLKDLKIEISNKNNEIKYLDSLILEFKKPKGFNSINDELDDFKSKLIKFESIGLKVGELERNLQFILEEEDSILKVNSEGSLGYKELVDSKIIIEYNSENITTNKLSPYGVKFLYWLKGMGLEIENFNPSINIKKIYKSIESKGLLNDFKEVALKSKAEKGVDNGFRGLEDFIGLDLLEPDYVDNNDYYYEDDGMMYFKLTKLGASVLSQIILNE